MCRDPVFTILFLFPSTNCPIFPFRAYQCRVRQLSLHCMQALVKAVEKRTLYGYWSSFIPDCPGVGPPSLTLLTIILKDPSPKVQPVINISFSLCDYITPMWGFISYSRCGSAPFRCCRLSWTARGSSWPRLKTRYRLVRPTPRSPSCWLLPSESCTAASAWLFWQRLPLKHSHRS